MSLVINLFVIFTAGMISRALDVPFLGVYVCGGIVAMILWGVA